ncbi:MAG: hypothetical protein LUC93_05630 [Planctomycetaceae bacterium]|nr:hypothetical protein [Planctomycetaceae bacterium]
MHSDRENHIIRRERERKEDQEATRREAAREAELRRCYRAVAATPEGRLILREYANDDMAAMAAIQFKGNAQDSFSLGRSYQALRTREILKAVLPRELYLEIIYPQEESHG